MNATQLDGFRWISRFCKTLTTEGLDNLLYRGDMQRNINELVNYTFSSTRTIWGQVEKGPQILLIRDCVDYDVHQNIEKFKFRKNRHKRQKVDSGYISEEY
jgi:hypothetical protein